VGGLRGEDLELRKAAATLLSRLGTASAIDALYAELADPAIGEHVLQHIRAEIDRDDATKLRKLVQKRAEAARKKLEAKVGKDAPADDPAVRKLAAVLRLDGYLADPEALGPLTEAATGKRPQTIRLAAIAALRRLVAKPPESAKKAATTAVAALIDLATSADAAIARAALDTLRGAQIPESLGKRFTALATAESPEVRRLAMERMPAVGGAEVGTLIAALASEDLGPREAAQRSLASMPQAAGPLVEALCSAREENHARRLVQALRAHRGRVPARELEALRKRVATLLEKGPAPLAAALSEALSTHLPDAHTGIAFERAGKLVKAGRQAEALGVLKPLVHAGARLDDAQRLFLGALGLALGGKDLLRAARTVDPVLQQFVKLLASGYPVARALLKDRSLGLDELFTLGFNFVESKDGDEKDFGRELLEAVIERQPRGKLATAAKNKLRISGALE
jgi:hypothetical protein